MHKSTPDIEAGVLPTLEEVEKMGELVDASFASGKLLAAEGLRPSSTGVRLNFVGGKRTVTPGPFTGNHGVPAGYAISLCENLDEAIERATEFANLVGDVEIDIRPVMEPWDLGFGEKPADMSATRYMSVHKADATSGAGAPPTPELMQAMGELVTRGFTEGWLLATDGFQPSSKGARLQYSGGRKKVIDGPFTESKEVIAGFGITNAGSLEEVIADSDAFAEVVGDVEIDILKMYDQEDFQ
jgi:hypothetical protein